MIVVSGTFDFDFGPGGRDRAIAEMTKVEAAARSENGCLSYQFYADRDDEKRFRVFEEWESLAALAPMLRTSPNTASRLQKSESPSAS